MAGCPKVRHDSLPISKGWIYRLDWRIPMGELLTGWHWYQNLKAGLPFKRVHDVYQGGDLISG